MTNLIPRGKPVRLAELQQDLRFLPAGARLALELDGRSNSTTARRRDPASACASPDQFLNVGRETVARSVPTASGRPWLRPRPLSAAFWGKLYGEVEVVS